MKFNQKKTAPPTFLFPATGTFLLLLLLHLHLHLLLSLYLLQAKRADTTTNNSDTNANNRFVFFSSIDYQGRSEAAPGRSSLHCRSICISLILFKLSIFMNRIPRLWRIDWDLYFLFSISQKKTKKKEKKTMSTADWTPANGQRPFFFIFLFTSFRLVRFGFAGRSGRRRRRRVRN